MSRYIITHRQDYYDGLRAITEAQDWEAWVLFMLKAVESTAQQTFDLVNRILALMAGLIGMVDAAFEHKKDFYVLDDLDEQKLYNCARNVEIAVWKMTSSRTAEGEPTLFANALERDVANLSFEREFGRIIGLLDMLSKVVADKHGRSVTRLTQTVASTLFLPIGALGVR